MRACRVGMAMRARRRRRHRGGRPDPRRGWRRWSPGHTDPARAASAPASAARAGRLQRRCLPWRAGWPSEASRSSRLQDMSGAVGLENHARTRPPEGGRTTRQSRKHARGLTVAMVALLSAVACSEDSGDAEPVAQEPRPDRRVAAPRSRSRQLACGPRRIRDRTGQRRRSGTELGAAGRQWCDRDTDRR